jgi:hypothetical protein
MAKIITAIICALIFCNTVHAQQKFDKKVKLQYAGNFQIGVATGAADKNELVLQAINGVQYKSWFAGLGAGIDQYSNKRSVPFFITLQKAFFNNKHQPFIYTNIGYNISWLKQNQKAASFTNYKELNGLYYDVGIGYKYVLFKHTAVGLSIGYSLKQQGEQYTVIEFEPTPTQSFSDKYQYNFRRLIIKFSYWF